MQRSVGDVYEHTTGEVVKIVGAADETGAYEVERVRNSFAPNSTDVRRWRTLGESWSKIEVELYRDADGILVDPRWQPPWWKCGRKVGGGALKETSKSSAERDQAIQRVREKIEADGLRCERLHFSDQPVRRGALFDMSGARVPFPEDSAYDRCFVALVDPDVQAQWGHPAFWAFVPAEVGGEIVVQPTEFPEHALGSVRMLLVRDRAP